MRITLTVDGARAGPLGPHAIRAFGAEGGTIGRSPEADWALPDPNRFLSQFHARILWQDGGFWLEDTSSNGTFVNGAPTALGRGARHRLAEGDRLALGDYAVFVSLVAPAGQDAMAVAAAPPPVAPATSAPAGLPPAGFPAGLPATALPPPAFPAPAETPPAAWPDATLFPRAPAPAATPPAAGLDAELAALLASFGAAPADIVAPPATPPVAMVPPPDAILAPPPPLPPLPVVNPLPTAVAPPSPVLAPAPPPLPLPAQPAAPIAMPMPQPRPMQPATAPAAPGLAMPRPPTPPTPPAMPSELPPELLADLTDLPHVPPPASGAAIPVPRRPRAAAAPASSEASDLAFWRGLGIAPDSLTPEAREAALEAFGRAMRAAADGLVALLGARRFAKAEFDLEQTQLAAADNNVFKFSPSGEAALRRLMENETGFTPVDLAVARGFDDLRAHELATAAGVQAALSAMLDRVSPAAIERRFAPIRGGLFTSRRARLWELYTTLHAEIADGAESRFKDVFSRSFASAYGQRARQAAQSEDR